jgi:hypothetical protein
VVLDLHSRCAQLESGVGFQLSWVFLSLSLQISE